jgi:hypothetical protein
MGALKPRDGYGIKQQQQQQQQQQSRHKCSIFRLTLADLGVGEAARAANLFYITLRNNGETKRLEAQTGQSIDRLIVLSIIQST